MFAGVILNDLAPQLRSFDAVTVRPRTSINPAVAENDSAAVGSGSNIELEAGSIDQSGGLGLEMQSGQLLPHGSPGSSGGATETSEGLLMREEGVSDRKKAESCASDPSNATVSRSGVEKGLTIMVSAALRGNGMT